MASGTRIGIRKSFHRARWHHGEHGCCLSTDTLPLRNSSTTRTRTLIFQAHLTCVHVHASTGSVRACGTILLAMQCLSQRVVPARRTRSLHPSRRTILLFCLSRVRLEQR